MMDALRAILLDLGVLRGRIKTEAFGPAEKPLQRQAAVQAAMAEAHPVTTPTVTFTLSGKAAPLPPGTTVLKLQSTSVSLSTAPAVWAPAARARSCFARAR